MPSGELFDVRFVCGPFVSLCSALLPRSGETPLERVVVAEHNQKRGCFRPSKRNSSNLITLWQFQFKRKKRGISCFGIPETQ